MPTCPRADALAAFRAGTIAAAEFDAVAAHLEAGCTACLAVLEAESPPDEIVRAVQAGPYAPTPATALRLGVGTLISEKYKLLEEIGEGGMGTVYLAQQTVPVRRLVAVKLIKPGMDSRTVLARFEAERQALALMDHPNIARVLDAGLTDQGRPYFVMELVRGLSLTAYCDHHRLTPERRLHLFTDVCHAVQHAHQKGVIHRDLKPGNVLVAEYDGVAVPKVIDFGVAKAAGAPLTEKTLVTGFGMIVGTPEYMAPEQAEMNAVDIDTRADIYALGVILFELLTSSTPLNPDSAKAAGYLDLLQSIRDEPPPRPSTRLKTTTALAAIAAARRTEPRRLAAMVRGELDWIVMKCLEKDRGRRYETANSLARDVQRFLAKEPVEARPPSTRYRVGKFLRRHRGAAVAAGIAAAALLLGAGASLWQMLRAQSAEARTSLALKDAREENANREAVQKFLLEKVFAAGRPQGIDGGLGHDVSLRKAIDAAVPAVAEAFRDRPLVEAAIRFELGRTYLVLGVYDLAATQLLRVREIRLAQLGPDLPDSIRGTHELGRVRMLQWSLPDALQLLEDAATRSAAVLGAEDRFTLVCRADLATAIERDRRPHEAIALHEEVLAIRRRVCGPDDADTLASMNALASPYRSVDRLPEAIAMMESVVAVNLDRHGANTAETIRARGLLAALLISAGRAADAIALFESAAPLGLAKFGGVHPATVSMHHNWAVACHMAGRHADAVRIRRRMHADCLAHNGIRNPDTLATLHYLADALLQAGDPAESAAVQRTLYTTTRSVQGEEHVDTRASQLRLVAALKLSKQPADAPTLQDDVLAWQRRHQDPRLAYELAVVGQLLLDGGLSADAEPLLQDCLSWRQARTPEDWQTWHTRGLLGAAISGAGRPAEGEPLLLNGYEGLAARIDAIPAPERTCVAASADRIIAHFQALRNDDRVRHWQAERTRHAVPK